MHLFKLLFEFSILHYKIIEQRENDMVHPSVVCGPGSHPIEPRRALMSTHLVNKEIIGNFQKGYSYENY